MRLLFKLTMIHSKANIGLSVTEKAFSNSLLGPTSSLNFLIRTPKLAKTEPFASLAVAAGEDPLWIAEVMGHQRPDQLFLKYASYLKGVKEDGEKLLELVGGKTYLRAVP